MTTGAAPALYQAFFLKLNEQTFKNKMEDDLYSDLLEYIELGYPGGLFSFIDDPDSLWWDDPSTVTVERRNSILALSLGKAYSLLETNYGKDPRQWDWARIHGIVFEHPLGRWSPINWFFNRGPIPLGGSTHTISNAMVSLAQPFRTPAGTAFRMVVDLNDVSSATTSLPTGASGHPLSRHYFDQNPDWQLGAGHTLFFERAQIEAHLEGRLILIP